MCAQAQQRHAARRTHAHTPPAFRWPEGQEGNRCRHASPQRFVQAPRSESPCGGRERGHWCALPRRRVRLPHNRALDARAGVAHSPFLPKQVLARNELVLGVVVTVPVSRRAGIGWALDVAPACPGLYGRRARWCRWARRNATCLGHTRTAARSRDLRSIWAHPPSPIPSTGSDLPSLVRGRRGGGHPICHGL